MKKRIVFIKELSEILGDVSVSSIRSHLQRKNFQAVPRPIYLGRRLAWSIDTIEKFIAMKETEAAELGKGSARTKGRPRKSFTQQGKERI
nr:transcriptional regulator [uncultured Pseudodesulfovibrio sp.]